MQAVVSRKIRRATTERAPTNKKVCPFGSDQVGQHVLHPRRVLYAALHSDFAVAVAGNAGDAVGDFVQGLVDEFGHDGFVGDDADGSHCGFLSFLSWALVPFDIVSIAQNALNCKREILSKFLTKFAILTERLS